MIRIKSHLLVLILLAALVTLASGTTVLPTNLAKIVKYTEKGFVCTIESVEVTLTEKGWAERVSAKVSEGVVGKVKKGDSIEWYQARFGEKAPIAGMPQYEAGGEYLIFLSARAGSSIFQSPFALGQGCFTITRDAETGAVFARNEMQNENLMLNLDRGKVGARIEKIRAAAGKSGAASSELESITDSARALATEKDPESAFAAAKSNNAVGATAPVQ